MSNTGWVYISTYGSNSCQGEVYAQSGYITNSCFYSGGLYFYFQCDATGYTKKAFSDASCSTLLFTDVYTSGCNDADSISYYSGCTTSSALPLPAEKTFATSESFRDSGCGNLVAYVADLNQQCVPTAAGSSYYADYPAYTSYDNPTCSGTGSTSANYFSDACTVVAGATDTYQSSDLIILGSYDDDATENALSGGAIAGIVIGVTAGIVLISALVYFLVAKKKPLALKRNTSQSDYNAF